ncbi:MAG: hypothetical protein AAF299_09795 [Pseudomonadota bacterium]
MWRRTHFPAGSIVHIFAAGLALIYAWHVSQSVYVTTGLQFIAPLLVIMTVHFIWIAATQGLSRGFSIIVYQRSAQSAVGLAFVVLSVNAIAPMPAQAADLMELGGVLVVVFCVAIIAIIAGIAAFAVYVFFKACAAIIRRFRRNDRHDSNSRLFDFGSIAATALVLCLASLEGLPNTYAFGPAGRSTASYHVGVGPDHVWQTMEQATSPEFPLPGFLRILPHPVDVVIDQGTRLGAMRKVKIQGREGTGYLTFRVVERTSTAAVFEVISDTSPIAAWVAHKRLVYEAEPDGDGTRLKVSVDYDRLLAPAWFFSPVTKGAAFLAVDVLARDVKSRAEARGGG